MALGDSIAAGYTIPEIEAIVPLTGPMIAAFNNVVAQVVGQFTAQVYLVDVMEQVFTDVITQNR